MRRERTPQTGHAALRRRAWAALLLCAVAAAALLAGEASTGTPRDLVASIGSTPNLGSSPDSGPFVELVKAIDDVYIEGRIERRVFPFLRSLDNVASGVADFHIPMLNNPALDSGELPYRFASETLGQVEFVLYSSAANPLTREALLQRVRSGAAPYDVRVLQGAPLHFFDVPVQNAIWGEDGGVANGLRRVAAGRLDGLIVPQEQADVILRELRLRGVHRAPAQTFDAVIAIARGSEGDAVDAVLSAAIRSLKASGRWGELYRGAHLPYQDWQPASEF